MPDLVNTDVTVSVLKQKRGYKERRHTVKLEFGDAALTYPAAGVPLPGFADYGFQRELEYLNILDPDDATEYQWKYDQANNKLRAWECVAGASAVALAELSGTAIAAQTLYAEAVGW